MEDYGLGGEWNVLALTVGLWGNWAEKSNDAAGIL